MKFKRKPGRKSALQKEQLALEQAFAASARQGISQLLGALAGFVEATAQIATRQALEAHQKPRRKASK